MPRFGVPTSLVFDNATYFSWFKLYNFSLENGILLKHSSYYYPKGNGLGGFTKKKTNPYYQGNLSIISKKLRQCLNQCHLGHPCHP